MEEAGVLQGLPHEEHDHKGRGAEVRCAVRFPVHLPVVLSVENQEAVAVTLNVSASGALFELDRPIRIGSSISFSMRLPGPIIGMGRDVLVQCQGRVVRCSISGAKYQAATTIDDYKFAEQ